MNQPVSRKYVLILCFVAFGILVVGALLRPKKATTQRPSPAETASLQSILRREELRNMAAYLNERASAAGRFVVYLDDQRSSGVFWNKPGQLLTVENSGSSGSERPMVTVESNLSQEPARPVTSEVGTGVWMVIVARSPDQQLIWTAAFKGGIQPVTCDGLEYRELILSTPLDASFSGGGAFNLDGALVGFVTRCGDSYRMISTSSVTPYLAALNTAERRLAAHYGLHVKKAEGTWRRALPDEPGVVVAQLHLGSLAAEAGLRAGDLITAVDTTPVDSDEALWRGLAAPLARDNPAHVLDAVRAGTKVTIQVAPKAPELPAVPPSNASDASGAIGIAFVPPQPPSPSLAVATGTPAYEAGLRSGDRITQLGKLQNPRPAEIRRALRKSKDQPLLVVFRRGSQEMAAVMIP